jgi:hypothetical protein
VEKGNGQQLKMITNYQLVGGCFPIDFECTTIKHDRCLAKTTNIDPALLKELPSTSDPKWHKLNSLNWQKTVTPSLTAKKWLCNENKVDGMTTSLLLVEFLAPTFGGCAREHRGHA